MNDFFGLIAGTIGRPVESQEFQLLLPQIGCVSERMSTKKLGCYYFPEEGVTLIALDKIFEAVLFQCYSVAAECGAINRFSGVIYKNIRTSDRRKDVWLKFGSGPAQTSRQQDGCYIDMFRLLNCQFSFDFAFESEQMVFASITNSRSKSRTESTDLTDVQNSKKCKFCGAPHTARIKLFEREETNSLICDVCVIDFHNFLNDPTWTNFESLPCSFCDSRDGKMFGNKRSSVCIVCLNALIEMISPQQ